MGSEHNSAGRLPEPPAPAPEAREDAIARALQQFDRLHHEPARDAGPRALRPTGAPRGRTTLARPSVRYLVAASVAAFIAVPVGWLYLKDAHQLEGGQTASKVQQETRAPAPPAESATRSVGDRIEAAAPPPASPAITAPPAAAPPPAAPVPSFAPTPPAAPAPSVAPAQRAAPAPGGALRSEPQPAPVAPPAPLARQQAPAAAATSQSDLGACSAGDLDRKITGCTRIIEDRARGTADRRQALLERGMAFAQRREFDRAIGDFTESIRLDPGNAAAFYNRSLAYRAKGEHDRARADCAQASGLDAGYRPRC